MFLKPIVNREVIYIINNLKEKTASGFDKISVKLLKQVSYFITVPF